MAEDAQTHSLKRWMVTAWLVAMPETCPCAWERSLQLYHLTIETHPLCPPHTQTRLGFPLGKTFMPYCNDLGLVIA